MNKKITLASIVLFVGISLSACATPNGTPEPAYTPPATTQGSENAEDVYLRLIDEGGLFPENTDEQLLEWGNAVCGNYEKGSDPTTYVAKMVADYGISEAAAYNLLGVASVTVCNI